MTTNRAALRNAAGEEFSTETLAGLRARFDVVVQEITVAGRTWKLARPRSADALIDEEAFQRDGRIPYWADVWTSSQTLAEELAKRVGGDGPSDEPRSGRLLELGCGIGFSSLVAAGLGYDVTATDYYPEALEFVAANAELNGLANITTRHLDWRAPADDLGLFDVVAAADVLYERPNVPLVAALFAKYMRPDGVGYCSDPERRVASSFADECRRLGLTVNCFIRATREADGAAKDIDWYVVKR
ncbi:MAG: methyltransferase domain-containing protein [Planctomycetia bacterium]|nr:methyltransferase domain-containing protein [Planctomycetia bacterium]